MQSLQYISLLFIAFNLKKFCFILFCSSLLVIFVNSALISSLLFIFCLSCIDPYRYSIFLIHFSLS
ncbi:hypothetical protein RhiirA5_83390 [Rhizophagus irregularis]|uniref:Uncharacterized protein n=1 Tax=Rhizophagus irregularis TaxID=588596 RepID=A0A2N0Q1M1_9GLOM|nr:hypothetical protein RhiirA5_83390 [Rhizophagus irregularis]